MAVICLSVHSADSDEIHSIALYAEYNQEVAKCIRECANPDTFVETRFLDDKPAPKPSVDEQRRGYMVFHRHWMDHVFPNTIPHRAEVTDELAIFASREEYEPVTFCLYALEPLKEVRVQVGELVSEDGARIAAPHVQIVRCAPRLLRSEEPLYEDGPVGLMNMPTYLESARPVDIPASWTVRFWLTCRIPSDAQPGTYQGVIHIHREGKPSYDVRLTLEVLPVTLRKPPQILGFWDFQRTYHDQIGSLEEVYSIMRDHGINAVFARAGLFNYDKPTDTYDFSRSIHIDNQEQVVVNLDGTLLEKHLSAAKRAGMSHVIFQPHLQFFVTKELQHRYSREQLEQQSRAEMQQVAHRFQNSEHHDQIQEELDRAHQTFFPMYSEAYGTLYVETLSAILAEVRKRKLPVLLLDPMDETYSHHVHNRIAFPFAVRHLELMKRAGAKTLINHLSPCMGGIYGEYVRDALRFLDVGMPGLRMSSTSPYRNTIEESARDFKKRGIRPFTYSNSGQAAVTSDMCVARFHGGFFFHTVGRDVEGTFDYIFYRPEGNPYNGADVRRLWSHERIWFFPPQAESSRLGGRALVLAAKREGIDDLRYLTTLDEMIQRAQSDSATPKSRHAAAAADTIRRKILDSFQFTDKGLDSNRRQPASRWDMLIASPTEPPIVKGSLRLHNGWDLETYDHSRRQIADAIVQLQKVLDAEKGRP